MYVVYGVFIFSVFIFFFINLKCVHTAQLHAFQARASSEPTLAGAKTMLD